ncbi:uncharacterized protein F4561_005804 [Lipingzhangella halophila]|uniref:DUF418 domain-containing protein n=1 Tax=Lipingzhangella halophila TaxID=1783352 RepID=A0A7W7RMU0_9ACTN|nr:DUF418 domain-containing protein [Lipingzhangella halophila]MBB4934910.1 uncharacterized protein [Lipingzhangella halophila]
MTSPASLGAREATPQPAQRLELLDVLRGVAILGTLATNVWLFTAPGAEASVLFGADVGPPAKAVLADPSAAAVAESAFRFAANGKFLALLTLLFGVGLAIQFESAARRGERWPGRYLWRALFLLFEGIVHFTLIFAWDVLMGYAAVALLVAWLLTRSRRAQAVVMWVQATLHVLVMSVLTAGLVVAAEPASRVPAEVIRLYAEGSYLDQVAFRLANAAALRIEPVLTFGLMVFLFLLGVRLFRAGAFASDDNGRRIRGRLLRWGLGAGVPLNIATTLAGPDYFLVDRYVAAPIVAVGLIGLIGVLVDRAGGSGRLVRSMSALGRMALSGYVTQNLICMLVCYGFGLGLASRLAGTGPWWVLGLWAAVCTFMLVAASLWLRWFRQGPAEALQKAVVSRIPSRRA